MNKSLTTTSELVWLTLAMTGNKIGDGDAVVLAEALKSCTQLHTVYLDRECHPVLQPVGCSVGC